MPCPVTVYSDGSWYCSQCGVRGDADEPVEDYCRKSDSVDAPEGDQTPGGE